MAVLLTPSAAISAICARLTSATGNDRDRVMAVNCSRSEGDNTTACFGRPRGMGSLPFSGESLQAVN